jgi:hypothetical protein
MIAGSSKLEPNRRRPRSHSLACGVHSDLGRGGDDPTIVELYGWLRPRGLRPYRDRSDLELDLPVIGDAAFPSEAIAQPIFRIV